MRKQTASILAAIAIVLVGLGRPALAASVQQTIKKWGNQHARGFRIIDRIDGQVVGDVTVVGRPDASHIERNHVTGSTEHGFHLPGGGMVRVSQTPGQPVHVSLRRLSRGGAAKTPELSKIVNLIRSGIKARPRGK